MPKSNIILLSRDSQLVSELSSLLDGTYGVTVCDSFEDARELFQKRPAAGFVADFTDPTGGGHAEVRLLDELHDRHPKLPIVVLSGTSCPEPLERRTAVSEMTHFRVPIDPQEIATLLKNGRCDHAADDDQETDPPTTVCDRPAATQADPRENPIDQTGADTALDGITHRFETSTLRMKQVLTELEVAAKHDVTILLIGETGSGKTYLSRLIHDVSPRRDMPFLTVACGALTEDLIESELFGHVKGAFTGAHADKEGKFIAAGGGTLLLDEIDVLSPEQQVKLLRVIETGEFEPVGSNKTLKSRARLVVASNLDLQPLVDQGKFRPDLYYRLNMLKFEVLPIRERKQDITPLARRFIKQYSAKHNVTIETIEKNLFAALLAYPWPGNVRELENVIQRAVIYCRDGVLSTEHLPPHILQGAAGPANDPSVKLPDLKDEGPSLERQMALTERECIEEALFRNNFSRTNTARDLGISRVTLYNKMKKYGMPAK